METKYSPKILLMGKAGVGKTSMRSIIFANCAPKETMSLGFTFEVNETRINFMGKLSLNLLDCGAQKGFIEDYFKDKQEYIFSGVELFVFVLEAEKSKTNGEEEMNYYERCINALERFSKNAKVFVLIHKMDLIPEERKKSVIEKRTSEVTALSKNFSVTSFATSIWDVSLYKAWTEIVSSLIIDKGALSANLKILAEACGAIEVILFEKYTFLLTSHYAENEFIDESRFEKISHIIKKFKLSCSNNDSQFNSMQIQSKDFLTYLTDFTKSTFIMIVIKDKPVNVELLNLNVKLAAGKFEDLIST